MAQQSAIQWTDATWNVARGCTKVDSDCKFCYMYRDSMESTRYNPLDVVKTKTVFDMPLRYKEKASNCWPGRPLMFTSSLTDFFHPAIDSYRHEAFDIIRRCPHIIFQILSKRMDRAKDLLPDDWGDGWDNVWMGTSVGHPDGQHRMEDLLEVPAKLRFLSLEPLHGPVQLPIDANDGSGFFDWVIVGGESGNENGKYRYRPCELKWIEDLVEECDASSTPVFVKQMGTHLSKQLNMSDRHGGNVAEFPAHLRFRQFPTSYDFI